MNPLANNLHDEAVRHFQSRTLRRLDHLRVAGNRRFGSRSEPPGGADRSEGLMRRRSPGASTRQSAKASAGLLGFIESSLSQCTCQHRTARYPSLISSLRAKLVNVERLSRLAGDRKSRSGSDGQICRRNLPDARCCYKARPHEPETHAHRRQPERYPRSAGPRQNHGASKPGKS